MFNYIPEHFHRLPRLWTHPAAVNSTSAMGLLQLQKSVYYTTISQGYLQCIIHIGDVPGGTWK